MAGKIEKILRLASDMQNFAAPHDDLTALLDAHAEAELSFDELELIAAGASAPQPDYEAFLKLVEQKK